MKATKMSLFDVTRRVLAYVFKCCPGAYAVHIGTGIVFSMLIASGVVITQLVFDTIAGLANNQQTYRSAIIIIMVFILSLVAREVLNGVFNYQLRIIGIRMHGFFCKEVAEKSAKLDPIVFEDPKLLDEINKASAATNHAFGVGYILVMAAIFYLPYFIFTAGYLYFLNPILVWAIILVFVPKLMAALMRTKLYAGLENKSAPIRREYQFYEEAIVDRQFFKETRLLGAFGFFKARYLTSLRRLNRETWRADVKSATLELLMSFLTVAGYLGILYLLFISLRDGLITIGAFAAVFGNITFLIMLMDELICRHFADATKELGRVSYLMNFFDLPEKGEKEVPINWQGDIEFKNVSFTYPNASKESLSDVSLTIKAGETVAIVGENGAGKSTLTGLLMGLYEPTSGTITASGVDIKDVVSHQLFKGVSAVFQKFQRYQLTLRENIKIGAFGSDLEIFPVMEEAGVELNSRSYPDGVDTVLSREFDGVDLSGGQWQRIAIARGLYRHHDLIILDEPTAAIDPLEESRLYQKFAEITQDKTAVIVTHRLGSAQIADKIIVLDSGKIIEAGTHQELLNQKGHYAKMYQSQAKWYEN